MTSKSLYTCIYTFSVMFPFSMLSTTLYIYVHTYFSSFWSCFSVPRLFYILYVVVVSFILIISSLLTKCRFGCDSLTGCLTHFFLFVKSHVDLSSTSLSFSFLSTSGIKFDFLLLDGFVPSSLNFENIWLIYIFEPTASGRPLLHRLIGGISP